jgi:hypothetical protein
VQRLYAPSQIVGQDNCGYRLGQQPQSVPNLTQRKQRESRSAIRKKGIAEWQIFGLVLGIARLRALRCGQNAYTDEHDRTHTNPLIRRVQEIRGDAETDDENEVADQEGRER